MESRQAHRKNEHLSLATKYYQQAHAGHPFDQVRLIHTALPEEAVDEVDISTELAPGLKIPVPFYIEAMTGGSKQAMKVNRQLARLAAKYQLPMASGSVSVALNEPACRDSFRVIREENPTGIVLANISASASEEEARAAIELLNADALELHLNAAQELIMPEGDRSFHWLDNIQHLVQVLDVPVIVKEVGFGMNKTDVSRLANAGVTSINVSGRGGTNFAMIENRRNNQQDFAEIANWGQTTPEALLEAHVAKSDAHIIASGGITSPLDVVKAGVLGASAVGVAGYFLNILIKEGPDALDKVLVDWLGSIPRIITLLGVESFSGLQWAEYVLSPDLQNYAKQRRLL